MKTGDRLAAGLGRTFFDVAGRVAPARLPILIFHRVLRDPDPLLPHEMTAARFDRLCAHIAATFRVAPLTTAVDALFEGRLPRRSLSLTFDDGYADNAEVALPILKRHGLTASVFVATGFIDGGRMWNDTVIESLRCSSRTELDLGAIGLGVHPLRDVEDRRRALSTLLPRLKYLAPAERRRAVDELHSAAGTPVLSDDLMMRSEQVRTLALAGIEIGAHTVDHPILKTLSEEAAEREMAQSRSRLEAIVDRAVETFAYPNGRYLKDFDERHVRLARRLGFRIAVTTEYGAARRGDDPLTLPRATPWHTHLWRWSAQLAHSAYVG